jgi:hypothetical protein
MKQNVLIIVDSLVEPPSEPFAFRTITMFANHSFNLNVLFHTTQDLKDIYYNWMKPKGLLDYISYILTEHENENGIRLETSYTRSPSIIVNSIRLDNQLSIIGCIKTLINIE